jgi:hypothetical protein
MTVLDETAPVLLAAELALDAAAQLVCLGKAASLVDGLVAVFRGLAVDLGCSKSYKRTKDQKQ